MTQILVTLDEDVTTQHVRKAIELLRGVVSTTVLKTKGVTNDKTLRQQKYVKESLERAFDEVERARRGEHKMMTDEEFMEVINTNEVALYTCAREVGKHMIEAGYGRIINIASLYGIQGKKGIATVSYSTAKGGVANFTRALACEWGEYGITVNCIAPGYFPTELMVPWIYSDKYTEMFKDRNPIGRYGRMEEVNSTIIYLAAEESSYITGVVLPMDGGWTAS